MPFSISSILAPVHLLAYSTLLGTELYQSIVIVKVVFGALPRSAFTSLQKQLFPIYFRSQSLLLLLAAVTIPPLGPLSLVKEKGKLIPFVVAGVTAGLNLMVFGPRTRELMIDRVHQATRDANLQLGARVVSEEMKMLNRSFARAHAMSIHLNAITIIATLWYGWHLASRLNL